MIIFQRDSRKSWLREALESVEKFLSSISIPIAMHLSRSIEALIISDQSKFAKQKHHIWVFEKKLTNGAIWQ